MSNQNTPGRLDVPEQLLALAPTDLINYRKERYDGGGFSVSLDQFAPEDVGLILQLYAKIRKSYDLWLYMKDEPNYKLMRDHIVSEFGTKEFLTSMRSIGIATRALGEMPASLQTIIHDIRGGALTALAGYASMERVLEQRKIDDLENGILKIRDHAKLMRNAIDDLDPVVRAADESLKVHYIDDFVNKWDGSMLSIASKRVQVGVRSVFEGSITNRCLETSAIDRVLYNYINNAARFAVDNQVLLTIFPVSERLVRWVVQNALSDEQEAWLAEKTDMDLKKLFQGGLTRGGHGIGLSGCVDFVATSFGLEPTQALDMGYIGAQLLNSHYYAWFHWPVYLPTDNDPICDCTDK